MNELLKYLKGKRDITPEAIFNPMRVRCVDCVHRWPFGFSSSWRWCEHKDMRYRNKHYPIIEPSIGPHKVERNPDGLCRLYEPTKVKETKDFIRRLFKLCKLVLFKTGVNTRKR